MHSNATTGLLRSCFEVAAGVIGFFVILGGLLWRWVRNAPASPDDETDARTRRF